MKNKKKLISQPINKHDLKNQKKQSAISKKSPIKLKNNHHQNPFLSSQDSHPFLPFKNINSYYGKKTHLNDLSQKKDSNQSSTHCSINNRSLKQKSFQHKKKVKKTKKNSQQISNEDDWQKQEVNLSQTQVMNLINSYAIKIQRQWRRYWFRKCLSFIILKQKQRRKYEQLNECYAMNQMRQSKIPLSRVSYDFKDTKYQQRQQKIDNKRRSLPKLNSKKLINQTDLKDQQNNEQLLAKENTSSIQNQATEEFFNSKKYGSLLSFNSLSKQDNINMNTKQAHERTSSLQQKFIIQQIKRIQTVQVGLNCSIDNNSKSIYQQMNNTPISDLRESFEFNKNKPQKKHNIKLEPKVFQYQMIIQNSSKTTPKPLSQKYIPQNKNYNNPQQAFKVTKKPPRNQLTSLQNLKSNYDIKFPSTQNLQKDPFGMNKIFKKCKKVIEKQVTKKIQTISKHYQDKQITQRTYKNLINQTQQKLKTQIKSLEIKEGNIKNSWREVYSMYKEFEKQNSFQQLDQKNIENDHDVSFDRWDFESSAKKSISQLESFQDFARQLNERNPQKLKGFYFQTKRPQNDQKSIQKVLDELDKLQSPSQLARKSQPELNQEQKSELSILEEFRQRQRSTSFQKKNEPMMVQKIPSQKEIKSSSSLKKLQKTINQNNWFNKKQNNVKQSEIENLQSIRIVEPKREFFEFSQIQARTPTKSSKTLFEQKQSIGKEQQKLYSPKVKQRLNTDQSEEDSQVEIKITSINTNKQTLIDKQKSQKQINQQQNNNNKQCVQQQKINQQQKQKLRKLQTQQKENQQKIKQIKQRQQSEKFIQSIGVDYFEKVFYPKLQQNVLQLSKLLTQLYLQKKKKKQLQLIELKKYPSTIDPQIDAINNWLLQISHHLLDNHNSQIKKNLLFVKQLPKQEMLQISHSKELSCTFYHQHPYITISEKIFKEFQFFYIKNVAGSLQIEQNHEQNFEHLLYAFHRCLIDCMNLTLLDELSIGRKWVVIPWLKRFKYKKNEVQEHTKQCLQRAINRVSGWAEYNLAQLGQNQEISGNEWRQYQEQKINLVIREQVLEQSLQNEFMESNLMLQICQQIYQQQIQNACNQLQRVFMMERNSK